MNFASLKDFIFYTIEYDNKLYLGELSPKTEKGDFMKYHLKRTNLPFYTADNKLPEAWEGEWSSDLKQNGFKGFETKMHCKSYSFSTVVKNLSDSLSKYDVDLDMLYNILMKQSTDIRPIENLLINVARKDHDIWNTHANFGLILSNVDKNTWNLQGTQIQRLQKEALQYSPTIGVSIDLETAKLISDPKYIENWINKYGSTEYIYFKLKPSNIDNVQSFIGRRISLRSLKKLYKSTYNYFYGLPEKIQEAYESKFTSLLDEMAARIKKLDTAWNEIKTIKKSNRKGWKRQEDVRDRRTYKSWLDEVSELSKQAQKAQFKMSTPDVIEDFMNKVNKWLRDPQTTLTSLLGTGTEYTGWNDLTNDYKEKLSGYIQNAVFKPIQNGGDITNFRKWQTEKIKSHQMKDFGGTSYQWFYIKYASEELDQELPSLREQSLSIIETLKFPFLENNWSQMYREQVSLWLNNEDGHNDITTYKNFSHRFLQLQTPEEITIY